MLLEINISQTSILLSILAIAILSSLTFSFFKPRDDVSVGLKREEEARAVVDTQDNRVLNPASFKPFKIISVTQVSPNTNLIRLEIPNNKTLGLSVGRHVSVQANINGSKVIRPYTPSSAPSQRSYFELLIKRYELGKLTPYLHSLRVGDTLEVRGPIGRFKYTRNEYKRIGFIAGGSGLTPCLQVIRCILEGPEGVGDATKFVLFFQNRTEADILLHEELEALAERHPSRLKVFFFLSNPKNKSWGQDVDQGIDLLTPSRIEQDCGGDNYDAPASSSSSSPGRVGGKGRAAAAAAAKTQIGGEIPHLRGYISKEYVAAYLFLDRCPLVGICGPSGFNESMKDILINTNIGHTGQSIYVW